MQVGMKVEKKGKRLIIDMPINEPFEPSKSGKSDIVASSHGIQKTDVVIDHRELVVGVNAFLYKKDNA